jgi:hypothetical protein
MAKNAKKNETPATPETETQAAPASAPSAAMVALFEPRDGGKLDLSELERRNQPRMYKPEEVPIGGAVVAVIVKNVPSPVSTVKGRLLWLRHENGEEFTFPCTGVIRNALAPGVDNEKELVAALDKFNGKVLVAKRTPDKISGKYKKAMFMFDVFTS